MLIRYINLLLMLTRPSNMNKIGSMTLFFDISYKYETIVSMKIFFRLYEIPKQTKHESIIKISKQNTSYIMLIMFTYMIRT